MAQMPRTLTMEIQVVLKMSFWDACKLRLAGPAVRDALVARLQATTQAYWPRDADLPPQERA